VADLWREVLGRPVIGVEESFFALGGSSIQAAILTNLLQERLGEYVYVVALFDAPTVAELARYLVRHYPRGMAQVTGLPGTDPTAPGESADAGARVDAEAVLLLRALIPPVLPPAGAGLPRNPRAVFILSPPRSGSTLLRVMLAGHPDLFAPPELELLGFGTLAEREAAFSGRYALWREGLIRAAMEALGADAEAARLRLEEMARRGVTTREAYRELQSWIGQRMLVDKTPSYALDPATLARAEAEFESPLYIHLLRHPGGMIASFEKAKLEQVFFRHPHDFSPRHLAELIWVVSQENIRGFLAGVPAERQHRLRFEELVRAPREELSRLSGFLGLPFAEGMLDPYADGSRKMTDGIHALSKMVGDVKFHEHRQVDAGVAESWRAEVAEELLGTPTWDLAAALGYPPLSPWGRIEPRRPEDLAEALPLSFAQQRLWFLDQLEPGNPAYNMPAAFRLRGRLDRSALAASLDEIVRRHEVLRTTFAVAVGQPVAVIGLELALPLSQIDLAALPIPKQIEEERRLAGQEARRPFDLARGPLLRAALLRLSPEEHSILFTLHHIVADGWSIGILIREVAALYAAFAAGRPSPLPPLPIQYADYAVWQRRYLGDEGLAAALARSRERLAGAPMALDLPVDRPRPPVQSWRGGTYSFPLPAELEHRLSEQALGAVATPFMVLLAAFEGLLHRLTGRSVFLVGSTTANRPRRELEGLIGFFVNSLVLRADLSPELTFSALVLQARETALFAFANSEMPFERLVEELRPERDLSRSPLVQVVFQLLNLPATRFDLVGLTLTAVERERQTAKFDLVANMAGDERGRSGVWHYSTDLFDRSTVVRMAGHFTSLLAAALASPDLPVAELPLLGEGERHQLLTEWNAGPPADLASRRPATVHDRFAAQAARRPDALALAYEGEFLSYGELARGARRLASFLAARGVGPGSLVGLCLERSLDLVVAILGVLEAGAAYVPLDPGYPEERLGFVLADSGLSILLTAAGAAASLPTPSAGLTIVDLTKERQRIASERAEPLPIRAMPEDLAYVIYTSGSTGRPKGVGVRHAEVSRLLTATEPWFGFGPEDTWTLFHSYAFDFSVWELWGALAHGGRLVVVPYWSSRSPEEFRELLWRERVTVLNQTPSAFRQLIWAEEAALAEGAGELDLRLVIFGGEALEIRSLAPWWEHHGDQRPRLVNMYGITETTVHVTYRELGRRDLAGGGSVMGRPIPDLAVRLLDAGGLPVPIGVAGELHVGGAGLAVGYLGRPELTAERFVPDPWSRRAGGRLYRSGDLARLLPDGDLEYLGRIDEQVKIRGFRIELGEIEAVLLRHPGVREAVVLAREEAGQERRLVAFIVADRPGDRAVAPALTLAELRQFTARWLPDYMLPAGLAVLSALPLSPSGKVDRRALLRLAVESPAADDSSSAAPRTALERYLASLWREALGRDPSASLGHDDDFFALGGNSISGAVLINRLQEEIGEIVHVVAIFDAPTISRLAAYLAAEHREAVARRWGEESLGELAGNEGEGARGARVTEERVTELRGRVRPLGPPMPPVGGTVSAKNPRVVFVLSPPRSGSTLLRVMLGGHPRLFAPPELELLSYRTLAERRQAFSGRDNFWLEGAIRAVMEARDCSAEAAAEQIEGLEREGLGTRDLYRRLQGWLGERLLVDKTPSYALDPAILARAEEEFAEPFYIHLIRHPHGMIRSFEEAKLDQIFFRDREPPFARRELAELIWLVSHRNISTFLAGVPRERWHEVRFEALTGDPEGTLEALCAALGLTYEPAMARPYEDRPASRSSRMTDGLHAESRMLGDVKFHTYRGVERQVADRWREDLPEDFLGAPTWDLAVALGYPRLSHWARIEPRRLDDRSAAPLSFAQQRLWFLDQLEPGSAAYNIPAALIARGTLSPAVLARTLSEVVRRHEALRTVFVVGDSEPVQRIAAGGEVALPAVDLTRLGAAEREGEARRLAVAEARRPFDLAAGPLLRAALLLVAAKEQVILFTLHHIISDGWSMGILVREVSALYQTFREGRPSPLPPLPVQYADYAVWQRQWLSGAVLAAEIDYWRQALAGLAPLDLPADHPQLPRRSVRGAVHRFTLGRELSENLVRLSRAQGATLFMTLLAGLAALLSRWASAEDLAVGTPIANRTRREIEGLIGFFVNTLVVRCDLSGDPGFGQLLGRVRQTTLAAYSHQDLPFEKVVEVLAPERDAGRTPLFQVLFTLQNMPRKTIELPGLLLAGMELEWESAKFDLSLSLTETADGLVGGWSYSKDLFEAATVVLLTERLASLLEGSATDPERRLSELPLLGAAESQQLLEWSGGAATYPREATIHGLFAEQARAAPDAVAVVAGVESLSYGELARRAVFLARHLRSLGVGPEVAVGVFLERSAALVTALLAILEAGGAYVPLDPSYPLERLAFLLGDTAAPVVVTDERLRGGLPATDAAVLCLGDERMTGEVSPGPEIFATGLAYVMYTSGSTGLPKGVAVPHRAVVRLVRETDYARLGPADRVAHLANTAFDAATFEVWGALANGGTLVIVERETVLSPERFAGYLAERELTALFLTTALFNQMAQAPGEGPGAFRSATHLLFGGEAVDAASVRRVLAAGPPARLVHVYGPTENTTFSTWFRVQSLAAGAATVPIGGAVANSTVHVLDSAGNPTPAVVPGELYVGGDGLARGYLGRPDLTAERFVPHPFGGAGERLYRTGDLVRWSRSGAIEFVGRIDIQVKIRGFRIEPGEIETALGRHPAVEQAVVVVLGEAGGDRRLAAYVVAREGEEPLSGPALRAFLGERLPAYMIPAAFVLLAALPLTPNGKVDRRALARLDPRAESGAEGAYVAPRTPVEELVSGIWSEVLAIEQVGAEDDFFGLGGHSLLATRVISRVRQAFGIDLALRSLFEATTVAAFAQEVESALAARTGPGRQAPPLLPARRDRALPLSFAQERLWLIDQLQPGSAAYNMPAALRLRGELDLSALAATFAELDRRHESLRTTFRAVGGEPVQEIHPAAPKPLRRVDLSGLSAARREGEARRLARDEARRPFYLVTGPLLRLTLVHLHGEPGEHLVLLTQHHIVSDGWSMGVL
ncbi:MAG: hypothetical protein QOJ16_2823, partial [Acidobacteriota bacterium]|nr:hypothetical protein [Acidobacteriota bacterium]